MSASTRVMPTQSAAGNVEIISITHRYPAAGAEVLALEDINLSIPAGRFISVVGPSGCGKSSLLMITAGLLSPTEGAITIGGERVTGPLPEKLAVSFQDACLLPWRNSLDNVTFPLELRGVPRAEREERGARALAEVGLSQFRDRYPRQLSGGMRQRVAVARALIQHPPLLLMDEPFGALDEQTRMEMGEELLRLWDSIRNTVIFVTHNLTEAVYLSDEVVVLSANPGRVLERVNIDLPRPRPIEVMETEEFLRLRNRIWRLIRSNDSAS